MGYLMRRNILAYKAPSNNEGYDLICIHPDPRHCPKKGELAQVRVQVKSRYATDCDRGFPVKEQSFKRFDFLVVAFLNIGNFFQGKDGYSRIAGAGVLHVSQHFIRKHHVKTSTWQKVRLRRSGEKIDKFKDEAGFELIAAALGVAKAG